MRRKHNRGSRPWARQRRCGAQEDRYEHQRSRKALARLDPTHGRCALCAWPSASGSGTTPRSAVPERSSQPGAGRLLVTASSSATASR